MTESFQLYIIVYYRLELYRNFLLHLSFVTFEFENVFKFNFNVATALHPRGQRSYSRVRFAAGVVGVRPPQLG